MSASSSSSSSYARDDVDLTSSYNVFDFGPAIRIERSTSGQPTFQMERFVPVELDESFSDTQILVWCDRKDPGHPTTDHASIREDLANVYRLLCELPVHSSSELKILIPNKIISMARIRGPATKNAIAIRMSQPITRFKFDHKLLLYTGNNFDVFTTREYVGFLEEYKNKVIADQAEYDQHCLDNNYTVGGYDVTVNPAPYVPCMFKFSNYGKCNLERCAFSHDRGLLNKLRHIRVKVVDAWRLTQTIAKSNKRVHARPEPHENKRQK